MLFFCFTILILGLTSGVYMETCPDKEDIYPCKCMTYFSTLYIECSLGKSRLGDELPVELLKQGLKGLVGKNDLDLKLFGIRDPLPPYFFSGIGIKRLIFSNSHFNNWTDDQPWFLGLENSLESFGIHLGIAPVKLNLGHLKKLRVITMSGNRAFEVGNDMFSNVPPSLEMLSIPSNQIPKVGSHAFSRLNNLTFLDLSQNRLGAIQRSMFPTTADRLDTLDLGYNAISDLPGDIFSRMPSLKRVNLDKNAFTTIDERTWSPVWQQLASLDITENNIACDERLNWIMKSKKRPYVNGKCSAPEEFKGMKLEKFLKSRSQ